MKKRKRKKWGIFKITNVWVLNQTWTKAFFISHISGWFIACLQTCWIVYEVRKMCKK